MIVAALINFSTFRSYGRPPLIAAARRGVRRFVFQMRSGNTAQETSVTGANADLGIGSGCWFVEAISRRRADDDNTGPPSRRSE